MSPEYKTLKDGLSVKWLLVTLHLQRTKYLLVSKSSVRAVSLCSL